MKKAAHRANSRRNGRLSAVSTAQREVTVDFCRQTATPAPFRCRNAGGLQSAQRFHTVCLINAHRAVAERQGGSAPLIVLDVVERQHVFALKLLSSVDDRCPKCPILECTCKLQTEGEMRRAMFVSNRLGTTGCIAAGLACGSPPAFAVEPITPPHCSTANNTVVCVADLDGNGKLEIIIGHMPPYTPGIGNVADGYLFILNSTGAIREILCLGSGAGQPAQCPPHIEATK